MLFKVECLLFLLYQLLINPGLCRPKKVYIVIKKEKPHFSNKIWLFQLGIIVDIFYDHFLAKNWTDYSDTPLEDYIQSFYKLLRDNFESLPENIQKMAPVMMEGNWLLIYSNLEGIDRVLAGMNRRTKNRSGMDSAGEELRAYYALFEGVK